MPPIYLVLKTIRYLISCKAVGTLVVPKWVSAPFWSYVLKDNMKTFAYVADILELINSGNIYVQGINKNSILGSKGLYSTVLAIRLDATAK